MLPMVMVMARNFFNLARSNVERLQPWALGVRRKVSAVYVSLSIDVGLFHNVMYSFQDKRIAGVLYKLYVVLSFLIAKRTV